MHTAGELYSLACGWNTHLINSAPLHVSKREIWESKDKMKGECGGEQAVARYNVNYQNYLEQ